MDGKPIGVPIRGISDHEAAVEEAAYDTGLAAVGQAGGTLIISAIKGDPEATQCVGVRRWISERRYGVVRRSVRLPDDVDGTRLSARIGNGLLEIVMGKRGRSPEH